MKKISFMICLVLLLNCIPAEETKEEKVVSLKFSIPKIIEKIKIEVEGANAVLYHPGKPLLPMYHYTLTFPFGTKVSVRCITSEPKTIALSHKLPLAPQPIPLEKIKTEDSNEFPENWFSFYTGGGLDENGEYKTFLTIKAYPVRYSLDTIHYIENLDLKIEYKEPLSSIIPESSAYDMVIIAPAEFAKELERLIEHKNRVGIQTILKPVREIYKEYKGVDKPEKIKYFIKDAIETWGIKYVLLVGGMKSIFWGKSRDDANQGTRDWYVPVRYTNVREMGGTYDPGFISDLYYADIYDSEGEFSSWDSNGNGIFAQWRGFFRDVIDLYPDVYVGRLACRNKYEVRIMVDKIIKYESEPGKWFDKIVFVAGDTHNDPDTNYVEGELICDYIFDNYMSDFKPVKLYASNREIDPTHVPSPENIIREVSRGCGHLLFTGHGNPGSWNTHWVGYFGWDDSPGGIHCYQFPDLSNGDKLPVCLVEGCHNSQFNITFLATLLNKPFMWTYGVAFPECWSWWLTRKVGGGSIATIGHTGLSYESVGETGDLDGDGENLPDVLEIFCGYQNLQFYKTYYEGVDILGKVWGGTIRKYLDAHPGMSLQGHAKTVEQWVLLGDPSLKIGGYPE